MTGVAILGAGFMGGVHAAGWKALGERAEVVAVYSRSPERADRLAEGIDARTTTDLDGAIDDPSVDIVDVCLPTTLHREAVERAYAAGKHVLLEKPIALTAEDADAIIAAAERSGRLLMVGLVLRFWPEYVELAQRVAAGEVGRPLVVSTQRLSPPADWNDWMRDPSLSGGVPVDLLVHDFDQMNLLFGLPREVFARASGDHVLALVEYEAGEGIAEGSMAMPRSYPFSSNIRVRGEDAVAEYAFSTAPAADGGNIGEIAAGALRLYPRDGEPESVPVADSGTDPFAAEIAYFLDCVERNEPPERGTAAQASQALLVSIAANRSLSSGRPEPVE
jgi:UDP-N-acetylglucosamine 3-dehydrogenase